ENKIITFMKKLKVSFGFFPLRRVFRIGRNHSLRNCILISPQPLFCRKWKRCSDCLFMSNKKVTLLHLILFKKKTYFLSDSWIFSEHQYACRFTVQTVN